MAFGAGRTEVASDDFFSSIDSNWDNGYAQWSTLVWQSGGHVDAVSFQCGMRRNTGTYAADQYSTVTYQSITDASNDSWMGALVRCEPTSGTDESSYLGRFLADNGSPDQYQVYEIDAATTLTQLATVVAPEALTVGDIISVEVEETTITCGSDASGSNMALVSSSDNTITGAGKRPGLAGLEGSGETARITAWSGGDVASYALDRTSIETDTFSSIDGDWTNGVGDYDVMSALGGLVYPFVSDSACAMVSSGPTFGDDQYSICTLVNITVPSSSISYCAANVRWGEGADDERHYGARWQVNTTPLWSFQLVRGANGSTLITTMASKNSVDSASIDDTLTCEVTGNVLFLGCDSGAGDELRLKISDNTFTDGIPGLGGSCLLPTHVRIGFWEAGNTSGPTAAITGTANGSTESQLIAGSPDKTIIITLTGDTWVTAGGTFDAQRQAIINGLDSAQTETLGWNNEVRDNLTVGDVARTSSTVVTISIDTDDIADYKITANEVITVTVPNAALTTSGVDITASPTVGITSECDQTLAPDTLPTQTNLTGAVTDIDESVSAPDANWLVLS